MDEETRRLCRKWANRTASELFVREKDEWYWQRTVHLLKEKEKKMTMLVFASMTISLVVTAILSGLGKSS